MSVENRLRIRTEEAGHVLLVSQYYLPEKAHYISFLADKLSRSGYQVLVLTGYPNYPDGHLYEGYRQRLRLREKIDGIRVERVPLYIDHSQSILRRTLNYASFALSSAARADVYAGADVTYVYATQLTAALGPWITRLRGGAPYVLHIQDLWPDSVIESPIVKRAKLDKPIEFLLRPWIQSVYRHSERIIAIAPTMREILVERGVPSDKVDVIYNWGDKIDVSTLMDYRSYSSKAPLRLLFAGNLGEMQDLETLIRAVSKFADDKVRLTVVGAGTRETALRELALALGSNNIEFVGRVPREDMDRFYADTDFAVVTLKDLPAFRGTIPSKFQSALGYGVPVITTVSGDVAELVKSGDCGFVAEPEDVDSLARAIESAAALSNAEYKATRQRVEELFTRSFSKEEALGEISKVLQGVVLDGTE